MAYGRKLEVLSSVVEIGGREKEWRGLTKEERAKQEGQLCRQISQSMSAYYSGHQKEWEDILSRR